MPGSSSPARRCSCRASRRRGRTLAWRRCGSASWTRPQSRSSVRSRSHPTTATWCCWPRAWKPREVVWTKGIARLAPGGAARRTWSSDALCAGRGTVAAGRAGGRHGSAGAARRARDASTGEHRDSIRACAARGQAERRATASRVGRCDRPRRRLVVPQAREQFAVVQKVAADGSFDEAPRATTILRNVLAPVPAFLGEPDGGADAGGADRRTLRSIPRAGFASGDAVCAG